jgi:hypothetical protein
MIARRIRMMPPGRPVNPQANSLKLSCHPLGTDSWRRTGRWPARSAAYAVYGGLPGARPGETTGPAGGADAEAAAEGGGEAPGVPVPGAAAVAVASRRARGRCTRPGRRASGGADRAGGDGSPARMRVRAGGPVTSVPGTGRARSSLQAGTGGTGITGLGQPRRSSTARFRRIRRALPLRAGLQRADRGSGQRPPAAQGLDGLEAVRRRAARDPEARRPARDAEARRAVALDDVPDAVDRVTRDAEQDSSVVHQDSL